MARSNGTAEGLLFGHRVALVGKLAGMSKRAAQQLMREQGATVLERPDATATLVVIGEQELPLGDSPTSEVPWEDSVDETLREAIERQTLEVIGETQLWQRLGLVELEQQIHSLYTPSMLAKLLGVSVSTIRRWQRHGWIVPVREVRRLAYFDFQEVATARRLTELLAAGMSPAAIGKKLAALARYLPDVKRPLAQLSIIVEGKHLLLRQGDGLVEAGGQLRLDFGGATDQAEANTDDPTSPPSDILSFATLDSPAEQSRSALPATPADMVQAAGQMEAAGELAAAAEMYRAALAAGGPSADICFWLAELLYQMRDLPAARERYYMAVELNEDYVEARANLGCVLAELGEHELAASAFEGALAFHDDYADAHYHLARTLDTLGRADQAVPHWEAFLRLAPASPWADEAHERLGH